jgi:hypothetical protein
LAKTQNSISEVITTYKKDRKYGFISPLEAINKARIAMGFNRLYKKCDGTLGYKDTGLVTVEHDAIRLSSGWSYCPTCGGVWT